MTMTESPPATSSASVPSPRVDGLYDALTTTDHKRIGRMWLASGIVFFVAAAVIGVMLGIENVDAGGVDLFGGRNNYFQYWSLYRLGLALLVAAPLFIGLATVIVPMQVGATNIAFPRAAFAAAWSFIIGAGITIVAVAAGGGWGALDAVSGDERDAIALTLVGTGLVIVSILLASVCIATTVISLRTPGMTLIRVPLFAWSMLVAAAVWLLTLPIALGNLVVIYVDLRGGPQLFGAPDGNAATSIYSQISWIIEQPQIYAFAIPALGILASIAPVVAGIRHAQHATLVALIGVFGFLSIGGWSQPAFHDNTEQFVFICFGFFAVPPVIGLISATADTLVRGRANTGLPPAHLLASLGGAVLLLAGTAAGLARVIEPLELGGRSTITGILNLVLFSAIVSAIAGMWFWAPKITGTELPAGLGRIVTVDLVAGAILLGGAEVVSGFFQAEQLQLADASEDIVAVFSVIATIGSVLIVLGAFGVVTALVRAIRTEGEVADDPWGGHTLEWATASPPPAGNFSEPPGRVRSEAPLLDRSADEGTSEGTET